MKHIRSLVIIAAMLLSSLSVMAERSISMRLNKHNFESRDTIKISAQFLGFDDDPIVGDVYVDLIDTQYDTVVDSVILIPTSDGLFTGYIALPSNGLDKHEDIMKLDRTISISGSRILHNGEEIRMHIDDEWAVGSSFNEFQKIPLEDIIFVKFTTGENFFLLGLTPYLRNKPALIVYTNKYPSKNKDYKYNNNFILQVTAPLESGENVATQEIVKIHKLDFFPYNEDKTQFNSSTNYLQNIPLYDSFYKNNGFSVR